MKEELQNKMEQIKEEKKIPKVKKGQTRKQIFNNILLAIFIMIYFALLTFGSINTIKNIRTIDFNIFSIILLAISIILFEKAYKKESIKIALYGIEILVVALITLCFSYIIFELNPKYKIYFYLLDAYVASYYLIKSLCIYFINKRKYKKEQLVSIKDIIEPVKQEKRESLKKEKSKENKEEKIDKKERIDKKEKDENLNKKIKIKEDEVTEKKKRGRPKKKTLVEEKENIEKVVKKRGRPRKEEQKPKEAIEETVPKKRGRPKKKIVIEEKEKIEKVVKKRGRPRKEEQKPKEGIEKPAPKKRGRPRKVS